MANLDLAMRFAGVIEGDADADKLEACADAAQAWYAAAGVSAALEGNALYDFWVANLTAWMFDNIAIDGDHANIPPTILGSVHQLRALPVPNGGEGA